MPASRRASGPARLADGGGADILSVTRDKLSSPVDVYNLEVEGYHTYFVASAGVWVHNDCGGDGLLSKTVREVLATRQGSVLRQFPGQFLNRTMAEIQELAQSGDAPAKTAWKLLTNGRFGK